MGKSPNYNTLSRRIESNWPNRIGGRIGAWNFAVLCVVGVFTVFRTLHFWPEGFAYLCIAGLFSSFIWSATIEQLERWLARKVRPYAAPNFDNYKAVWATHLGHNSRLQLKHAGVLYAWMCLRRYTKESTKPRHGM